MRYREVKDLIHMTMINEEITWEDLANRINWKSGRANLYRSIMYNEPKWDTVRDVLSALNIKVELK